MAVSAKVATAYVEFVAQTASFKKACHEAGATLKQTSAEMRADMTEAKGSIALLGEEVGVHMPRHLRTFVAGLPGVASAMSAAFNAVAVFALAEVVFETGKKIYEFAEKNEEAARKNAAAWASATHSIGESNEQLDLTKIKLENAIAKMEHKPQNAMKEALAEARVEAEKLGDKLDADIEKIAGVLKGEQGGWFASNVLKNTGGKAASEIAEAVQDQLSQIGAGTFKPADSNANFTSLMAGRGDKNSQYGLVINENLAKAAAELARVAPDAERFRQRRLSSPHMNMSNAETEEKSLTQLVAYLRSMQESIRLTGDISRLTGIKGALSAAGGAKDSGAMTINLAKLFNDDIEAQTKNRDANIAFYQKLADDQDKAFGNTAAAAATADAARATLVFNEYWQKEVVPLLAAKVAGTFQAERPSVGYSPESEFSKAADGAKNALNDLTDKFTDTARLVEQLVNRSLNQFNDTVMGLLTGDRRASFSKLGSQVFGDASKGLLEKAEGGIMKGLGFGKGGKYDGSPDSPFHVVMAGGGGAGGSFSEGAGKGLLGFLNDSDFFTKGFLGNFFGAGGLFGGGHALGGRVGAGVPIDVGELGRERFTPDVPGRITPHNQVGGAGNVYHIDARGTDPALTQANVQRAMQQTYARAVADSTHIMRDGQRRTAQ